MRTEQIKKNHILIIKRLSVIIVTLLVQIWIIKSKRIVYKCIMSGNKNWQKIIFETFESSHCIQVDYAILCSLSVCT